MPETVGQEELRRVLQEHAKEWEGHFFMVIDQEGVTLQPGDQRVLVEGGMEAVRVVLRDIFAIPSYIDVLIRGVRNRRVGNIKIKMKRYTAIDAEL